MLTLEALLIAEVNLAVRRLDGGQTADGNVITLRQMAAATLGWQGGHQPPSPPLACPP